MTQTVGHCRGAVFKSNIGYVKKKYGSQGLNKITTYMKEKGAWMDLDKIRDTEWYPIRMRIAFLDGVYELFSGRNEEMFSLGKYAALHVERLALLVRYTKRTEEVVKESGQSWDKHWDIGSLEIMVNEHGHTLLRLEEFNIGPHQCKYLSGYFVGVAELSGANNVSIEETACISKGDPYHEFDLHWE
ncbi:MAG: hypothetical protein KAT70_07085 [Thermoplasmata archaeon]|nr:hypothetical protein [Thermoplasmata archaeon]